MSGNERFDRSIRLFGVDGQAALEQATVVFAGVGGLGSVAVQHAALLHIGQLTLVDPGLFKESNRNRYVTSRSTDTALTTRKVDIARRLVESISPGVSVTTIFDSIISESGLAAIKEADVVVGSVDNEGSRLLLLQACGALGTPYIDLATEVFPGEDLVRYGGHICCSFFGEGCLSCLDVLDRDEASRDLATEGEMANRRELYGVDSSLLRDSGPSVAPLNGVVASAGMLELMVRLTGLRKPQTHLNFNGNTGKLSVRLNRRKERCYFCDGLFPGGHDYDVGELLNCGRQLRATLIDSATDPKTTGAAGSS